MPAMDGTAFSRYLAERDLAWGVMLMSGEEIASWNKTWSGLSR